MMSETYKYSLLNIARAAKMTTLPAEGGAWVCITGCPVWPRGQRLIPAHQKIGIQHLDIYWANKEVVVSDPVVRRWGRPRISISNVVAYDIYRGSEPDEAFQRAVQQFREFIYHSPHQSAHQITLLTISHPSPEEVRLFNGEVRIFTQESVNDLLASDWVDVIRFGKDQTVALDDAAQELKEAFMVDGLTEAEAQLQIMGAGVLDKPVDFVPQWFYRPKGAFRAQFCEEED